MFPKTALLAFATFFTIAGSNFSAAASSDIALVIRAAGSLAAGVGPTMVVSLGGQVISSATVNNTSFQDYTFLVPDTIVPGTVLDIAFTNDAVINGQDRNLYIQSVSLDGVFFQNAGIVYDRGGSSTAATDGINVAPYSGDMPWSGNLRIALDSGVSNLQLGLVINDADPYSVQIGEYYRVKRAIPVSNIVHVNFPVTANLTPAQFAPIKQAIDAALPPFVQALAIAWTEPHRVKCYSITSAISMGYKDTDCAGSGSANGTANPFNHTVSIHNLPYAASGIRPSMLLASSSVALGKQLIDRGLASDHTFPTGTAYLMQTTDDIRNIRAGSYDPFFLGYGVSGYVNIVKTAANTIQAPDVLFYFQGLTKVTNLTASSYLPGAIIDNLTSCSGHIDGGNIPCYQDSILDYLAAGATGSYGTVVEPYAVKAKFPDPRLVMSYYTKGTSLVEAYWHSVKAPYQGLFVGDPLANPWKSLTRYVDYFPPPQPSITLDYSYAKLVPAGASKLGLLVGNYNRDNVEGASYRAYEVKTTVSGGTTQTVTRKIGDISGSSNQLRLDYKAATCPATTNLQYYVTAVDTVGNVSAPSNRLTIPCPPPLTTPQITSISPLQVYMPGAALPLYISISMPPPGSLAATGYIIYDTERGQLAEVNTNITGQLLSLNFTYVFLPVGQTTATYNISVAAKDSLGNISPRSNIQTFTARGF